MQIKLNLRKLSAINNEIQGVIRVNRRKSKETQTVVLRAFQTEPHADTVDVANLERKVLYAKTLILQQVLSRFRGIVACKNAEFGINAVLQELREAEDNLAIKTDFLVEASRNPQYDGYTNMDDASAVVRAHEGANDLEGQRVGRRQGSSDAAVRLISDTELAEEIKVLQRTIKTIKNDRLVGLNFKEVSVEISEKEKEILMDLNIL